MSVLEFIRSILKFNLKKKKIFKKKYNNLIKNKYVKNKK